MDDRYGAAESMIYGFGPYVAIFLLRFVLGGNGMKINLVNQIISAIDIEAKYPFHKVFRTLT